MTQYLFLVGKKQRITLIECNNDINSMIDIAKIADLVRIELSCLLTDTGQFEVICVYKNVKQIMYYFIKNLIYLVLGICFDDTKELDMRLCILK